MSTTIFICQLPQDKQKAIEKTVMEFLYLYGYRGARVERSYKKCNV